MLNDEERKVLETIEKSKLVNKSELLRLLEKEIRSSPALVLGSLESKKLIAKLSGISIESSYIITQAGQRLLREVQIGR